MIKKDYLLLNIIFIIIVIAQKPMEQHINANRESINSTELSTTTFRIIFGPVRFTANSINKLHKTRKILCKGGPAGNLLATSNSQNKNSTSHKTRYFRKASVIKTQYYETSSKPDMTYTNCSNTITEHNNVDDYNSVYPQSLLNERERNEQKINVPLLGSVTCFKKDKNKIVFKMIPPKDDKKNGEKTPLNKNESIIEKEGKKKPPAKITIKNNMIKNGYEVNVFTTKSKNNNLDKIKANYRINYKNRDRNKITNQIKDDKIELTKIRIHKNVQKVLKKSDENRENITFTTDSLPFQSIDFTIILTENMAHINNGKNINQGNLLLGKVISTSSRAYFKTFDSFFKHTDKPEKTSIITEILPTSAIITPGTSLLNLTISPEKLNQSVTEPMYRMNRRLTESHNNHTKNNSKNRINEINNKYSSSKSKRMVKHKEMKQRICLNSLLKQTTKCNNNKETNYTVKFKTKANPISSKTLKFTTSISSKTMKFASSISEGNVTTGKIQIPDKASIIQQSELISKVLNNLRIESMILNDTLQHLYPEKIIHNHYDDSNSNYNNNNDIIITTTPTSITSNFNNNSIIYNNDNGIIKLDELKGNNDITENDTANININDSSEQFVPILLNISKLKPHVPYKIDVHVNVTEMSETISKDLNKSSSLLNDFSETVTSQDSEMIPTTKASLEGLLTSEEHTAISNTTFAANHFMHTLDKLFHRKCSNCEQITNTTSSNDLIKLEKNQTQMIAEKHDTEMSEVIMEKNGFSRCSTLTCICQITCKSTMTILTKEQTIISSVTPKLSEGSVKTTLKQSTKASTVSLPSTSENIKKNQNINCCPPSVTNLTVHNITNIFVIGTDFHNVNIDHNNSKIDPCVDIKISNSLKSMNITDLKTKLINSYISNIIEKNNNMFDVMYNNDDYKGWIYGFKPRKKFNENLRNDSLYFTRREHTLKDNLVTDTKKMPNINFNRISKLNTVNSTSKIKNINKNGDDNRYIKKFVVLDKTFLIPEVHDSKEIYKKYENNLINQMKHGPLRIINKPVIKYKAIKTIKNN